MSSTKSGSGVRSQCPGCLEMFSDPRVLPCLHTLCMNCLDKLEPFGAAGKGPQGQTQKSLLCPVCDSEVLLPLAGVKGLVPDLAAQEEVLLERLQSGGHEMTCDLCGESRAEKRCQDCKANMCEFCCQAHRRQKRTANHLLVPVRDLPPGLCLSPVPCCSAHPLEELRLFCEPCAVPSCRDCALVQHHGHVLRPVLEVAGRHREQLHKVLNEAEPQLRDLEDAINGVYGTKEALTVRAEALRREVEDFAEKYIRAVREHRARLLGDIDEEMRRRQQTLSLQGARIQQRLSDLHTATQFTRGVLGRGPDLHLVRAHGLVLSRLKELSLESQRMTDVEETTGLQFSPQEEAGQCQGYPMYGVVKGRGVNPERCAIRGLQAAWEGELCGFTLICNDGSGDCMGHGGQQPAVRILHGGSDRPIRASVRDNHDGTYHVSYTPAEPGELSVSVLIKGRHMQGSPFSVTVKGKSRKHPGIYHCCSFCSSGGQKDARCGCGGTMPGGYQGCGHGHKGHPGHPHWSCCGCATEKSECWGVKDTAPRNLLRTVAL
ncbi:tripartite motif-containing protein 45 [Spea bombifrons]|uniref:tripartite motif-containing protein 45 n=1 Tax=Spea bombifrons TaxID=233779 RepID=UPI00234A24B4|nr:tripartite motif-containing protein 45 [Spea bombifrons]